MRPSVISQRLVPEPVPDLMCKSAATKPEGMNLQPVLGGYVLTSYPALHFEMDVDNQPLYGRREPSTNDALEHSLKPREETTQKVLILFPTLVVDDNRGRANPVLFGGRKRFDTPTLRLQVFSNGSKCRRESPLVSADVSVALLDQFPGSRDVSVGLVVPNFLERRQSDISRPSLLPNHPMMPGLALGSRWGKKFIVNPGLPVPCELTEQPPGLRKNLKRHCLFGWGRIRVTTP